MDQIGVFTPEQARQLWQDYLQRKRETARSKTAQAYDVSPHRVMVKNTSGEKVPAFGCMQITGVENVGERTYLTIDRPTDQIGDYLINSQYEIDPAKYGWAYRHGVVIMLGDEPDRSGWTYRPIVDSWELEPGPGPFVAYGREITTDRALIGRIEAWPDATVVLDETVETSSDPLAADHPTYDATWLRENEDGKLEETDITLSVVNRFEHIDLAQYTLAVARRINREWRLISADCSPLTDWPP